MAFRMVRDDIVHAAADAMILPSNQQLRIDGGAGLQVARLAGLDLVQRDCDAIGACRVGDAVATSAYGFPARYLLHTVGPAWIDGESGEDQLLLEAYLNAFGRAADLGCVSLATPLLAAGSFGFSDSLALSVAVAAARSFLDERELDITLYLFGEQAYAAGKRLTGTIDAYIDEHYFGERQLEERHFDERTLPRRPGKERGRCVAAAPSLRVEEESEDLEELLDQQLSASDLQAPPFSAKGFASCDSFADSAVAGAAESDHFTSSDYTAESDDSISYAAPVAAAASAAESVNPAAFTLARDAAVAEAADSVVAGVVASAAFDGFAGAVGSEGYEGYEDLRALLDELDAPFSPTLLRLIDERGMTDAQVYRRANMSRQLFSKIRANQNYRPTKKTALALCVALGLSLPETEDLLKRAGYSLSHASMFDVIVEYFITAANYDIFEINEMLFAYDQPLLG